MMLAPHLFIDDMLIHRKDTSRYHPYSHSELSLVIFRYEIWDGFYKQTNNKQMGRKSVREGDIECERGGEKVKHLGNAFGVQNH